MTNYDIQLTGAIPLETFWKFGFITLIYSTNFTRTVPQNKNINVYGLGMSKLISNTWNRTAKNSYTNITNLH